MSLPNEFRTYAYRSEAEKKMIVREALTPGVVRQELLRKYSIRSMTSLYRWIEKYGDTILVEQLGLMSKPSESSAEQQKSLEGDAELRKRIAELEQALFKAELKSELLEAMIDIAEKDLKLPIRKKFGPQQSQESDNAEK
jgi:transposase-like protein